jgi:hypothetical protein
MKNKLDKYIMMSLRTSFRAKQSDLSISDLLFSIATTFKLWFTITEELLALAKYRFSILAKAQFNSLIYLRPKGRGNSILLCMSLI